MQSTSPCLVGYLWTDPTIGIHDLPLKANNDPQNTTRTEFHGNRKLLCRTEMELIPQLCELPTFVVKKPYEHAMNRYFTPYKTFQRKKLL